jgi:uncharacterized protein YcnI
VLRRLAVGVTSIAAVLGLTGVAAFAHVTIQPGSAAKGSFAELSFRVPNETEGSATVKVEVQFPADHPIPYVSTKPMPGWTVTAETQELAEPIEVEGNEITEAVTVVTWEGGEVKPGEYDDFSVSAGPLPDDVDELVFKAIQTYDDGTEVAWVEPTPEGGEEPGHPAPVLELIDGGEGGDHDSGSATTEPIDDVSGSSKPSVVVNGASKDDLDNVKTLAMVALFTSAIGVIAGIAALGYLRARRSA